MPTLNETLHAGSFLISEGNGYISRDAIVIASGKNLLAGAVLGKASVGAVNGAAMAGNAGAATIGSLSAGAGARPGVYKVVIVEPVAAAGTFTVEDPDGVVIGHGNVGVAFTGPINFTLTDGTPDAAAGDVFNVTVAAGTGKFAELNPAGVNGADQAAGILFDDADALSADKKGAAITRQAEVLGSALLWPSGITTPQKNQAIADLAKLGIIVR